MRRDLRLGELEERLHPYRGPEDDPDPPPGTRQAAVAIVLRERPQPGILLVKRAVSERDPWSGHMALPGGRRDPGDPSLLHTAVRETAEETALLLDPARDHLGRLELVRPTSTRLPAIEVAPFVFRHLGPPSDARVNSPEIAGVHWVPLELLLDPATRGSLDLPTEGAILKFPTFEVEAGTVWGLTYRILRNLLDPLTG